MPNLTKADVEQINEAVRTGNIKAARRILRDSDDPRAGEMLAKLNAKFPPKAPSPLPPPIPPAKPAASIDLLPEAKRLIAQRDYDGAEKLLWESDDPAAGDLLRKIELVRSVGVKAAPGQSAPPVKPKNNSRWRYARNILLASLLGILVVCGVLFYTLNQQSSAFGQELGARLDLQRICFDAYYDDYFDQLGSDRFGAACKQEAQSMLSRHEATVLRCHDAWKDEKYKFMECLIDGGAKFSGVYMLAG